MSLTKEQRKRYRQANKNKDIARWRFLNNYRNLKRRAKKMCAYTTEITKEFILKLYNKSTCFYCKKNVELRDRTIEHVIPLANGGKHEPENLEMACKYCNCSKKHRDISVFLNQKKYV